MIDPIIVRLCHPFIPWIKSEADALPCHFHISICLLIIDLDRRVIEKNAGFWDEMLLESFEYFVQRPCYQWEGSQKDPSSHWRIWRTPDPGQETEAKMFLLCFKVVWFSKDNPTGHSERKKKKRQTKEKVGRQYQRVDRNGLCQLN